MPTPYLRPGAPPPPVTGWPRWQGPGLGAPGPNGPNGPNGPWQATTGADGASGGSGHPPVTERLPLARSAGGRMAGVCAGIAQHLGVQVRVVRVVMIALAIVGPGLPVYGFLWVLMPRADDPGGEGAAVSAGTRLVEYGSGRWGPAIAGGLFVTVVGIAYAVQQAGVDGVGLVIPLLFVVAGATVSWSHLDSARRSQWLGTASGATGFAWVRVGVGLALAVVGLLAIGLGEASIANLRAVLVSALAIVAGALLILAPWVVRLRGDVRAEQIAAARATERADIAAHLHDSVLQTLALIQRRAQDPTAVAQLARAQERELRSWLYAGPNGSSATLASAVQEAANEVEDVSGTPIELVVTGDREIEPHGEALTRALREALLNATRHGKPPVTAYVEIGPQGVEAFVRDRGDGFDLDAVPADRLGVRGSIVGRMERHGGSARVRQREDGTEVELRLPPVDEEED